MIMEVWSPGGAWNAMTKNASTENIREQLKEAAAEITQIGGWSDFKSGEWLFHLMEKTFRHYAQSAAAEQFALEFPRLNRTEIAEKLIDSACNKAALAGAVTGAAVSADELIGLFTAGEAVVGLPVNIAVAATAICAEVFFTARIQLQLVARLASLYGATLDLENPDDLLAIMNFAFGGAAAEALSKEAAKSGAKISAAVVGRFYAKKESFEVLKRFAKKLGYKLLRRSVVNGVVPGVSMFMGAFWNKRTTRTIGRNAQRFFERRVLTLPRSGVAATQILSR
jgi:uncharacterized protein (DUF697 family)